MQYMLIIFKTQRDRWYIRNKLPRCEYINNEHIIYNSNLK